MKISTAEIKALARQIIRESKERLSNEREAMKEDPTLINRAKIDYGLFLQLSSATIDYMDKFGLQDFINFQIDAFSKNQPEIKSYGEVEDEILLAAKSATSIEEIKNLVVAERPRI